MSDARRVLVTGAGGFIGHHLVQFLADRGYWVRGVDLAPPAYEPSAAQEFEVADLRCWENCLKATRGVEEVYALAASRGGRQGCRAAVLRDNTLLHLQTLDAARVHGVQRCLFAMRCGGPDGGSGESPDVEGACRRYREDFGLETRIARLPGVFGPLDAFDDGREKLPAAICRQVALAQDGDALEVCRDGCQAVSYCYIDDCLDGIYRLMRSGCAEPLHIGPEAETPACELLDTAVRIAGKRIGRRHDPAPARETQARPAGQARLREALGWEPRVPLEEGLARTYRWIERELAKQGRLPAGAAPADRGVRLAATA